MAPRAKETVAVKRKGKAEELVEARKTNYANITDLPMELLHMIMLQVRREWYVKPCSLTYRTLREVAVEYLQYPCPKVDDLAHLLAFMRNHPRIGQTITVLHLRDSVTDAKVIDHMKLLFPTLSSLHLEGSIRVPLPACDDARDLKVSPLRLLGLTFSRNFYPRAKSYIPGVMYLLSLVEPKDLLLRISEGDYGEDSFDVRRLAGLPAVESIRVSKWCSRTKPIAPVVDVLSKTLARNSLRSMWIEYDSRDTLRAYTTMFERVGSNITALTVIADPPYSYKDRAEWLNPLDDFTLLNIQACKKLESLTLPIYIPQARPEKAVSHVVVDILVHYAPPTLRHIALMLYDLPRPTTLGNRVVLKLQAIDKVVTQARFPHLKDFQLHIKPTDDLTRKDRYWEKCADAARRALPNLHASGLLKLKDGNYSYMRC